MHKEIYYKWHPYNNLGARSRWGWMGTSPDLKAYSLAGRQTENTYNDYESTKDK